MVAGASRSFNREETPQAPDEAVARSLRFRALRASQRRRERQNAVRVEVQPETERRFARAWLLQEMERRFGITGLMFTVRTDAEVVAVEVDEVTFATRYGQELYASVVCAACGEPVMTQATGLADIGELVEQAGMHCGGRYGDEG